MKGEVNPKVWDVPGMEEKLCEDKGVPSKRRIGVYHGRSRMNPSMRDEIR